MSNPTDAPKQAPARPRSFTRGLIALVLLLFVIALMWVTFLNWRKDGHLSFRVFDTAWWRPGVASAQPVIDGARDVGSRAGDALWGDDGLVDQASRWWNSKSSARAKPDGAAAKPASETPPSDADRTAAAEIKRLEGGLADAEMDFQKGLDQYRQAKPKGEGIDEGQREHLRQARARFLSTKDLLGRVIGPYEAAAGHDDERVADAKALQQYNERLLLSLNKLLDVP